MRNVVESANRNLKRTQFENIADPDLRAIHGNTFTYIVVALAAVVQNMRQSLTFYKGELAVFTMTAKNEDIAHTLWQSDGPALYSDLTIQPPLTFDRTIRPARNHSGGPIVRLPAISPWADRVEQFRPSTENGPDHR